MNVLRKHGVINHRQGPGTEVKEVASLRGAILKSDNLAGPLWGSPKQRTMVKGKVNKEVRPSIYPLFFGNSIGDGTYSSNKAENFKKHSMKTEDIGG